MLRLLKYGEFKGDTFCSVSPVISDLAKRQIVKLYNITIAFVIVASNQAPPPLCE